MPVVAVIGIAVGLTGGFSRINQSYSLSVSSPHQVAELMQLANELEQIYRWHPRSVTPGHIAALAQWIETTGPHQRWSDFMRKAGSNDAVVQSWNQFLVFLEQGSPADFSPLKSLDANARHERLQTIIAAHLQQIRNHASRMLLDQPQSRRLLRQLGIPDPPVTESDKSGLPRWVKQFISTCRRDVAPIDSLYRFLEQNDQLCLGEHRDYRLYLRRMRYSDSRLSPLIYNGLDSGADMAVWISQSRPDTPLIGDNIDTGIRLIRLGVQRDSNGEARWQYLWPPDNAGVDPGMVNKFLHRCGVPQACQARNIKVGLAKNSRSLAMSFSLHHRYLPGALLTTKLTFAPDRIGDVAEQIRRMSTPLLAAIKQRLLRSKFYRGLALNDLRTESKLAPLQARIKFDPRLELDVLLHFTVAGNIRPALVIDHRSQQRLIEYLLAHAPILQPARGMLAIDKAEWQFSPPGINGTLAIAGTMIGCPTDYRQADWAISPSGTVTLASPGAIGNYLRQVKASPPCPTPPADLIVTRSDFIAYLRRSYPALSHFLHIISSESVPDGLAVTVGLQIGDWPELALGPLLIRGHSQIQPVIQSLVAREAIIRAAERRWRRPFRHPRLGKITAKLIDFDAALPTAVIECCMAIPIGAAKIKWQWPHRLKGFGDKWLLLEPRQLIAELAKHIPKLLSLISAEMPELRFAMTTKGGNIELHSRLTLNPLAIYANAQLQLPFFQARDHVNTGIELAISGVRIDEDGVHLPDNYRITLARTFPFVNFAISDPSVEINFAKHTVAIATKITPPVVPLHLDNPLSSLLVAKETGFRSFRTDNLWLHILFLQASLAGNWRDWAVTAQGNVRIFKRATVGTARFELNFRRQFIEGMVEAGPRNDLSFQGAFHIGRDQGVWFAVRNRVIGFDLRGKIQYDWNAQPTMIRGAWSVAAPLIGNVEMQGSSDLGLQKYVMDAYADVKLLFFFSSRYHFHVDSGGWFLKLVRSENWGSQVYIFEAPHARALSNATIEKRLQRLQNCYHQVGHAPSRTERQILERHLPVKSPEQKRPALPPVVANLPAQNWPMASSHGAVARGNLAVIRRANDLCFVDKENKREYLRIAAQSLGVDDHHQCVWGLWQDANQRSGLLIWDWQRRKIAIAEFRGNQLVRINDHTQTLTAQLGELFPNIELVKSRLAHWRRLYLLLLLYTRYHVWGPQPTRLFTLENGCGIASRECADFIWGTSKRICQATIPGRIVGKSLSDAFYRKLATLSPEHRQIYLCKFIPAADGSFTRLAFVAVAESQDLLLYLDAPPASPAIRCTFVPGATSPQLIFSLLDYVIDLAWQKHAEIAGSRGYLGPAGVFIYHDRGFWPASSHELLNGKTPVHYVRWHQFYEWRTTQDTRRFLPQSLQTSEARTGYPRENLATTAVSPYAAVRKSGWGAAPMGLLIGLSRQDKGTTK